MDFKNKYIKYKNKYFSLQKKYEMIGGLTTVDLTDAKARLRRRQPPPRQQRPIPPPPPSEARARRLEEIRRQEEQRLRLPPPPPEWLLEPPPTISPKPTLQFKPPRPVTPKPFRLKPKKTPPAISPKPRPRPQYGPKPTISPKPILQFKPPRPVTPKPVPIVGLLSDARSGKYYEIELNSLSLKFNILILGTHHTYIDMSHKLCDKGNNDYRLINYIKNLSKYRCIDLFHEISILIRSDSKKVKMFNDVFENTNYQQMKWFLRFKSFDEVIKRRVIVIGIVGPIKVPYEELKIRFLKKFKIDDIVNEKLLLEIYNDLTKNDGENIETILSDKLLYIYTNNIELYTLLMQKDAINTLIWQEGKYVILLEGFFLNYCFWDDKEVHLIIKDNNINDGFKLYMDSLKKKVGLTEWNDKYITEKLLFLVYERHFYFYNGTYKKRDLISDFTDILPLELLQNSYENNKMIEKLLEDTFYFNKVRNVRAHYWDIRSRLIYRNEIGLKDRSDENMLPFLDEASIELMYHYNEMRNDSYLNSLYSVINIDIFNILFRTFLLFDKEVLINNVDNYNERLHKYFELILDLLIKNFIDKNLLKIRIDPYLKTDSIEIIYKKMNDYISNSHRSLKKIIEKQFNKSIFYTNQKLFFEKYIDTFVQVSRADWGRGTYFFCSWLTDTYSVLRMFKSSFDSKKHLSGDECDNNSNFKNILFVGGDAHADTLKTFIEKYFNSTQIKNIIEATQVDSKCIDFRQSRLFN